MAQDWIQKDNLQNLYGVQGERPVGDEFSYNAKTFVVKEATSLSHNGRIYNCACFLCCQNEKCVHDFRYCSGECYSEWRKDGKSVYFEEVR